MSLTDILHKMIDVRTEQDRQEAHEAVDELAAASEAPAADPAPDPAPEENPEGADPDAPAPDPSVLGG